MGTLATGVSAISPADGAAARPDAAAFGALSDEALALRFGSGDSEAFRILYSRHRAPLYRFALRLTRSRADADEVFQDVWIAVIKGRQRYRPAARFAAYLFAIAHRRVADTARAKSRRAWLWADGDAAAVPAIDPSPLALAENSALGAALSSALAALPMEQREAFLLQAEGGLRLDEIAEATGVSRETVKSRLRYANAKLRTAMKDWQR
jgi:RNA polymerase sigma-70 factor (ECF subfamily)